MAQIRYGRIPQGATIIGTVRACETCGAEMLLQHSQRAYRICEECAAALPDPLGDTLEMIRTTKA